MAELDVVRVVPGGAAAGGSETDRQNYAAQTEEGEEEVREKEREMQNINSMHLHVLMC